MVDFINNMTHEFKTPISTVALACEAMSRPDVLEQHDTLLRYNRMIRDENTRMHKQVEKILQMAQLERGEYELNIQPVDVHALITQVSDNASLQLEQCQGKLELDLAAQEQQVAADKVHLTNVIQNLLDNAIKYSPERPAVTIKTRNQGPMLVVRISDQGIGIAEHDHKRVFEKYFRCHTGNRHDVKGFGLGLSYVKLMVEAHGGVVEISSQSGAGTSVDVFWPLITTIDSEPDHD
jgi:two-component system phosphate regulon sensor histidine kinase PhoR